MIAIVWHFDVKSGKEPAFEELYGAEGEWTGPTWSQRKGVKR